MHRHFLPVRPQTTAGERRREAELQDCAKPHRACESRAACRCPRVRSGWSFRHLAVGRLSQHFNEVFGFGKAHRDAVTDQVMRVQPGGKDLQGGALHGCHCNPQVCEVSAKRPSCAAIRPPTAIAFSAERRPTCLPPGSRKKNNLGISGFSLAIEATKTLAGSALLDNALGAFPEFGRFGHGSTPLRSGRGGPS